MAGGKALLALGKDEEVVNLDEEKNGFLEVGALTASSR
jgi:hypothetical protein